ncbi:major pilu subunit operon regulatory protein PapB [Escherichia coli]|uniref:PapB/FocB family fimbrial expression transcriptional regulator n=1 Tax=Escherichia coli TaxID=562 RepID=UPI000DA5E085|nr:PapB/FocB family fimbrial expression transcriptional regulator [Escherichia coli]SQQ14482.1 major pilu subunit operon regulatory protein PapB [Escherichia coli]HCO8570213.1 transcriptional regulator [Escherichia coli]
MDGVVSDYNFFLEKSHCSRIRRGVIKPGILTDEQYELLIELSPVYSSKIIYAMRDYLVAGHPRKTVCERHNVSNGYLSTSLKKLYYTNSVVIRLMQIYKTNHQ